MTARAGTPGGAAGRTIDVRAASGSYMVRVGSGLLGDLPRMLVEHAPAHRYAVISDDHVAGLYAEGVVRSCIDEGMRAELFTFPAGEASKTRKQWSILTDALLDSGFGRDGAVVAVGGGVTGDLAGFVAATYMRGVPVVQVPTSLVAMIDASVGGKTGVDVRAGKNLVGAFHPPRLVLADPDTIATLPVDERAQGLAEAVKHGAILDGAYFDELVRSSDRLMAADAGALYAAVVRSVELKAGVVEEDEHEAGRRQVLNFGHTLGHAFEAASGYALGHGSAVAVGMILEARLGEALGKTETGTSDRIEDALTRIGLGLAAVAGMNADKVLSRVTTDKKAKGGKARYVLLETIGRALDEGGWSHEVPEDEVERLVRGVLRSS